jgi:hypothetical protein
VAFQKGCERVHAGEHHVAHDQQRPAVPDHFH